MIARSAAFEWRRENARNERSLERGMVDQSGCKVDEL
jgi:hypothetical protein